MAFSQQNLTECSLYSHLEPPPHACLFKEGFRAAVLAVLHSIEESRLGNSFFYLQAPFHGLFLEWVSPTLIGQLATFTKFQPISTLYRLSELMVPDKGYSCCGRTSALLGGLRGQSSEDRGASEAAAGEGTAGRALWEDRKREVAECSGIIRTAQTQTRMFSAMAGRQLLKPLPSTYPTQAC